MLLGRLLRSPFCCGAKFAGLLEANTPQSLRAAADMLLSLEEEEKTLLSTAAGLHSTVRRAPPS